MVMHQRILTPREMIIRQVEAICADHGVTWAEVAGPRKPHHVLPARRAVCWHLRTVHQWSYRRIGDLLGGRDHTTIYDAICRYKDLTQ